MRGTSVGERLRHPLTLVGSCLAIVHLAFASAASAQAGPTPSPRCGVFGRVTASGRPLPGVALTVSVRAGEPVAASSTGLDGSYVLRLPGPGPYVVTASLAAFADGVREVTLAAEACESALDLELVLKSRAAAAVPSAPAPSPTGAAPARAGARPGPGGRFRDLSLGAGSGTQNVGEAGTEGQDAAAQSLLPPGFSAEAPTESFTLAGGQVQTVDSLLYRDRLAMLDEVGGDLDALGRRIAQGGFPGATGPGGLAPGGPGSFGGPGGGPGGGGRGFGGGGGPWSGFGGRGRSNRLQGSLFYNLGDSALDAAPYPLNGRHGKADYLLQRFGFTLGGPLRIPGVYDGSASTSFFMSYLGNHSDNPVDAYSTVPTAAERRGDLSALGGTIVDPGTGLPFPGNVIPASRIDPSAQALLGFLPLPNVVGQTQNYRYLTAVANTSDQLTLRLTHVFGGSSGGDRAPRGSGRGGPGGFVGRRPTLSVAMTYGSTSSTDTTSFPTLGGSTHGSAWDVPVSFSFTGAPRPQPAPLRLQPGRDRQPEPVRVLPGRGLRGRDRRGIPGPPRLGGAQPLLLELLFPARSQPALACRPAHLHRRHGDADVGAAHGPPGRRVPRPAPGQPGRPERPRQLRLHGPVHGGARRRPAGPGHRPGLRRLPAGASPAGLRSVRPRARAVPRALLERLPAGRLAPAQRPHPQPGPALRVRLALHRGQRPPRQPRRDARLHGGRSRPGRPGGRVHRPLPGEPGLRRLQQPRAPGRRGLEGGSPHHPARGVRHQLQPRGLRPHRARACRGSLRSR